MILDTSALIAILRLEAEAPEFARLIERAARPRISAVSYVEAGAVIDGSKDSDCGTAELSVNLGLTGGHGSLLLDL